MTGVFSHAFIIQQIVAETSITHVRILRLCCVCFVILAHSHDTLAGRSRVQRLQALFQGQPEERRQAADQLEDFRVIRSPSADVREQSAWQTEARPLLLWNRFSLPPARIMQLHVPVVSAIDLRCVFARDRVRVDLAAVLRNLVFTFQIANIRFSNTALAHNQVSQLQTN